MEAYSRRVSHPTGDPLEINTNLRWTEYIEESLENPPTVARSSENLIHGQDTPISISYATDPDHIDPQLVTNTRDSPVKDDNTPFRVHSFADKESLAGWFPQIHDNEKTSLRIRLSKRNQALLMQVALIAAIFATNLGILLYAHSKYPSRDGVGLLFAGDCDTVKSADRWLHLLINVLSTGMLSASTFCIQLQASPTREDVDKAHKLNKWLDIGAPSLRNLKYIGRWRLVCCIVLAVSSLPIHLIFNSAVFQALASNDYSVAVVKDSFLSGATWDLSTAQRNGEDDPGFDEQKVIHPDLDYQEAVEGMQRDVMNGLYERKNVSECYALYADYWAPRQGNVVVMVKNTTAVQTTSDKDSLLLYDFVAPRFDNYAKNLWAAENGTKIRVSNHPDTTVNTLYLGKQHYEASYCLVQFVNASATRCRLEYSTHILYTVVMLNFLKLSAMLFVYTTRLRAERRRRIKSEQWGTIPAEEHVLVQKESVLSTLGDAISSFLQEPDETTKDMCLATKHDFTRKKKAKEKEKEKDSDLPSHPRAWKMSQNRWMAAATWQQWLTLVLLYVAFIVGLFTTNGLLVTSLKNRDFKLTFSFFRSLGFGAVSELTYLNIQLPRSDPVGLIANVLIINSPQLLFSLMYSVCGAVVTTLLVQREFSRMYTRGFRKPLRVSEPVGIQRSSYFISLPLRYGVPVNIFSAVFHWLISQSYFLARITALLPTGEEDYANSFSTLGYSPYAIIVTGIIAFGNLLLIVLLGCRKYDGTMGLVSTNSMAISAACHGLPEDRAHGHLLPLQWGVVEVGEDGVGHCASTSAPCHLIRKAEEGVLYR
ncbi:hypothetical protein F4808DRAFT_467495 [Astrocystis sublimbata]|nr:hypothetical protein F4808DRAFT_467495 [Astrocystis sublimbata]